MCVAASSNRWWSRMITVVVRVKCVVRGKEGLGKMNAGGRCEGIFLYLLYFHSVQKGFPGFA
jgi:hypothetical protein